MTQTEQWIACLALVYAVPSFLSGIGLTLLFTHWRDRQRAKVETSSSRMPGTAKNAAPESGDFLLDDFRLPQFIDSKRLIGL